MENHHIHWRWHQFRWILTLVKIISWCTYYHECCNGKTGDIYVIVNSDTGADGYNFLFSIPTKYTFQEKKIQVSDYCHPMKWFFIQTTVLNCTNIKNNIQKYKYHLKNRTFLYLQALYLLKIECNKTTRIIWHKKFTFLQK